MKSFRPYVIKIKNNQIKWLFQTGDLSGKMYLSTILVKISFCANLLVLVWLIKNTHKKKSKKILDFDDL